MYGAYCVPLPSPEKLFGDSFQYVQMSNVPNKSDLCLEKKIEGYPTWIASDGAVLRPTLSGKF